MGEDIELTIAFEKSFVVKKTFTAKQRVGAALFAEKEIESLNEQFEALMDSYKRQGWVKQYEWQIKREETAKI